MSVQRITRRDGTVAWKVRWREGARQPSRLFDRKRDAVAYDTEVRRRRRLGALHTLTAPPVTLDGYVAERWATAHTAHLAPSTRRLYAWLYDIVISPGLGGLDLRDITPETIATWQTQQLAAGRGREQIRKAHTLLGNVLQRALEAQLIASNPQRIVRKVKPPPRRRVAGLAPGSVEAIRTALLDGRTRSSEPLRDATLVSVMAYAGLRPSEALALRWRDVRDRTLYVDAEKTGEQRSVRLLAPLAQDLREWRLASGRPKGVAYVFPTSSGRRWSDEARKSWARRAFAQAVTAAGVERVTPYGLRHAFASLLAHEGRSGPYVADQLGHGLELSQSTYQHVLRELEDQPAVTAEDAIREARNANARRRVG